MCPSQRWGHKKKGTGGTSSPRRKKKRRLAVSSMGKKRGRVILCQRKERKPATKEEAIRGLSRKPKKRNDLLSGGKREKLRKGLALHVGRGTKRRSQMEGRRQFRPIGERKIRGKKCIGMGRKGHPNIRITSRGESNRMKAKSACRFPT